MKDKNNKKIKIGDTVLIEGINEIDNCTVNIKGIIISNEEYNNAPSDQVFAGTLTENDIPFRLFKPYKDKSSYGYSTEDQAFTLVKSAEQKPECNHEFIPLFTSKTCKYCGEER
jgi:hypothetical protein